MSERPRAGANPLPLAGWRVLLPRPTGRSAGAMTLLDRVGAQSHAVPFIAITGPTDTSGLDAAVIELSRGEYDWVGFTSVNAVRSVIDRAGELSLSPVISADCRVAAVGPATAESLRSAGLPVDMVPETHTAVGLIGIWPRPTESSRRVLLPQSAIALPTLADGLSRAGYQVDVVVAYQTTTVTLPTAVSEDVRSGAYDAVLLTSPSTVSALVKAGRPADRVVIGAIGTTTAQAAQASGLRVDFIAQAATDQALVDGLVDFARSTTGSHGRNHETPSPAVRTNSPTDAT